jgi:putative ATP-binding cassette transporter
MMEATASYLDMAEAGTASQSSPPTKNRPPSSSVPPNSTPHQSPASTRGFPKQYHAVMAMTGPYFVHQVKARWLLGGIVVLTLLNSGVRVIFSYLARDFWSALSDQRSDEFWTLMQQFLLAMVVLAPITVLYRYYRQQLAIQWREWMTERMLTLYFTNHVYYGLERTSANNNTIANSTGTTAPSVDNPDQRIAEDVRSFTEYSLTLALTVLLSLVDLICFSTILFTILPALFVAILGFAITGTMVTLWIGKSLVQLNFEKLQKEANFRYSLLRTRENAEAIALLQGESVEVTFCHHCLDLVIHNMHALNAAVRNLEFFTTYYYYVTWILPIVVVAPEYFAGTIELGVVQQAASSFSHVLDDLSLLVNQWESLTEFSAGIDRLYTFWKIAEEEGAARDDSYYYSEHSDSPKKKEDGASNMKGQVSSAEQPLYKHYASSDSHSTSTAIQLQQLANHTVALSIHNLTLTISPHHHHHPSDTTMTSSVGRTLIQDLHLSLPWGDSLLICGPSGSGKSSLVRAIAGLWKTGCGSIQRPLDSEVYVLPQKPYCAMGSLREQLLYPSHTTDTTTTTKTDQSGQYLRKPTIRHVSNHELSKILRAVDLEELPSRVGDGDPFQGLDVVMDWSNTLSLGEQQRLAFGRILVHQPRFVILDESTSALPLQSERRMYHLLQSMRSSGTGRDHDHPTKITYISVGHRPSLEEYHNKKLTLQGDKCTLESLRPMPSPATVP